VILIFNVVAMRRSFLDDDAKCDGPPYIYATTHHEVKNILKYSRNGCLLMDNVLIGGDMLKEDHFTELRSMALGKYRGKEVLFVADASTHNSSLVVYSQCDHHGHRSFVNTVVAYENNKGADHTYGVDVDYEGNVYASFQHTDTVLRFARDTLLPMKLPPALQNEHTWREFFPGTFAQFGDPKEHDVSEQGIRSIAFVFGNLWVANEDIGGVAIFQLDTGLMTNIIVVENAIGLYYDRVHSLVFVGSKKKHWAGAVYAINPRTLSIVHTYTTGRMNHPTGITSYGDDLFVAEIDQGHILRFSIASAEFLDIIVSDPPGELEQLILSNC
jgi:outer membrane protein assembly factor BamB